MLESTNYESVLTAPLNDIKIWKLWSDINANDASLSSACARGDACLIGFIRPKLFDHISTSLCTRVLNWELGKGHFTFWLRFTLQRTDASEPIYKVPGYPAYDSMPFFKFSSALRAVSGDWIWFERKWPGHRFFFSTLILDPSLAQQSSVGSRRQ